jgi:acyl-CoA thioesterase FadM
MDARVTVVCVDMESLASKEIPAEYRQHLQRCLEPESPDGE